MLEIYALFQYIFWDLVLLFDEKKIMYIYCAHLKAETTTVRFMILNNFMTRLEGERKRLFNRIMFAFKYGGIYYGKYL